MNYPAIVLAVLLLISVIVAVTFIKKYFDKKAEAYRALGKPMDLKYASMKLYGSNGDAQFVLQTFITTEEQTTDPVPLPKMYTGVGLLAHPDAPNTMVFCLINFLRKKVSETVSPDGKTRYNLKHSSKDHYYLEQA